MATITWKAGDHLDEQQAALIKSLVDSAAQAGLVFDLADAVDTYLMNLDLEEGMGEHGPYVTMRGPDEIRSEHRNQRELERYHRVVRPAFEAIEAAELLEGGE